MALPSSQLRFLLCCSHPPLWCKELFFMVIMSLIRSNWETSSAITSKAGGTLLPVLEEACQGRYQVACWSCVSTPVDGRIGWGPMIGTPTRNDKEEKSLPWSKEAWQQEREGQQWVVPFPVTATSARAFSERERSLPAKKEFKHLAPCSEQGGAESCANDSSPWEATRAALHTTRLWARRASSVCGSGRKCQGDQAACEKP